LCVACATTEDPARGYSKAVIGALETAGENRAELEKVLNHYAAAGDSLKLRAAMHLIANMEGHSYVTYKFVDTAGTEVIFNALDYADYPAVQAASDSIEETHGELDYKRKETIEDLDVITADFLIEQINYAFKAWRERPWAKGLSFDDFTACVLPYRGSNEPLEPWRKTFWDKYADITTHMADSTDPVEAAALINDDIKSWFTFDPHYYYHPTDQGMTEMLAAGKGRCEDMTNVTIYAMRANGLAVTSDYTPHWANTGNNHAWNAIVTPDGRVIPFMGAEANPGAYGLVNKAAKVYRKTFAKQPQNLCFQDNQQEKTPGWLAGKSYVDVSPDYLDVCDITVTFERDIPDSVNIAYLCVFNSGEWRAVHWGRITDNMAAFTDMGTGVAYLPALYMNEEIVPFGRPFVVDSNCTVEEFQQNRDSPAPVRVTQTTQGLWSYSTESIAMIPLSPKQEYELCYWDDGWHSIATAVAGDGPLVFDDVPTNGLYWLTALGSDREERIFSIEDGIQVWW
ncbi:MAG: transglutaminase domain-containing protein, partial [candidate division Zixibacteria bacterium]|nr:transglutaminase domain-containing protein [candidate division Zixibacteria bacterium]